MKNLSLVLIVTALALPQAGQAGWWRTYGGATLDKGNCVQLTSDGNYIISGSKNNDNNLWLLKVDTSGNVLWSKTYGRSEGIVTRWLEETSDGDYIVAPRTPSLLKVDAKGDSLWSRDYGTYSYCVQPVSDGGYVVIGGTNGYGYDNSLVLVKTNSNGDTLWSRSYKEPGNTYNTGFFIQTTKDGGYVIAGVTEFVDSIPDYQWSNLWLVKTDNQGNKEWSKTYGAKVFGYVSKAYCVRQTKDNGYIIIGVGPGGLWLLKTNPSGDTLWTKTYGISSQGTGYSVQQTQDGGYIITGSTETFTASLSPAKCDLWLLKTDSVGDTLWTHKYPGGGSEAVGTCVQETSDNGYIVTGVLNGDLYLLKTDSLGLLAIDEFPPTSSLSDWSIINSFGSEVTLRYKDRSQGFHASIFNVSGQKVDDVYSSGATGSIKWGSNQPSGVYFVQIQGTNRIDAERVVIIH